MIEKFADRVFVVKILKYVTSGGIGAFVNLLSLYLLTDVFHLWYIFSSWIAFVVTFFVSFTLQRFWTFVDVEHAPVQKQLFLFFVTALINIAINTVMLYVLSEFLHLHYLIAQFIALGVIAIGSFFVYQTYVFAPVKMRI